MSLYEEGCVFMDPSTVPRISMKPAMRRIIIREGCQLCEDFIIVFHRTAVHRSRGVENSTFPSALEGGSQAYIPTPNETKGKRIGQMWVYLGHWTKGAPRDR